MRYRITLLLLGLCLMQGQVLAQAVLTDSAKALLTDPAWAPLFDAVQMQKVFKDPKTFADSQPKYPIADIFAKYKASKSKKGFSLANFVKENFIVPDAAPERSFKGDPATSVKAHIEKMWDSLALPASKDTGTLIGLPKPHIMPGGHTREAYYWDSYFIMMGLVKTGRLQQARNMLDNFSYLIDKYGHVPAGTRTYYLDRSQPPMYALMVRLIDEADTAVTVADFLPYLKKEYDFWMDGRDSVGPNNNHHKRVVRLSGGEILNRYWDPTPTPRPEAYWEDVQGAANTYHEKPIHYQHVRAACESGWNFGSRWMGGDQAIGSINTSEMVPVDLNSLLYELEKAISDAYHIKGDEHEAEHFANLADDRERAIINYCWSTEEGYFFDYSFVDEYPSSFATLAGIFPLFVGIATQDQAFSVSEKLEEEFLKDGGLTCSVLETGQQWDAPNGWAPLQWAAFKGLHRYGMDALADDIGDRWVNTIETVFREKGLIFDKYNVVNPKEMPVGGPALEGYGWTNGVYLMLKRDE